MKKLQVALVAASVLALAAGAALAAEGPDFKQRYREVRDVVRKKPNDTATVELARELTKLAETDDEKIQAFSLLADACNRAKKYRDAADAWKQCFLLEGRTDRKDRAQRVARAAAYRLSCFERIKPFPQEAFDEALRETLAWKDGNEYSVQDKELILDRTVRALSSSRTPPELVADVEAMLKKNMFGDALRPDLLEALLKSAARAGMAEKLQESAQTILESPAATPTQRAIAMLYEARGLYARHHYDAAVAKAEDALRELPKVDRTRRFDRTVCDELIWVGSMVRDELSKPEKAHEFFKAIMEYAPTDYWIVPARLEIAETWRRQGEFDKAMAEYEAVLAADKRLRSRALLPRAEMVYYQIGDKERGARLLREACQTKDLYLRSRVHSLFRLADHLQSRREYDAALQWLALVPELPGDKPAEVTREAAVAYYKMGSIWQLRGDKEKAKAFYRKAVNLEGGDMGYRVRARNELEQIEYFE
jgi:tetratricopeptide (TPR) repeat protein